jgi:NAD(P)H-quinone oxidoreductase subunit 4
LFLGVGVVYAKTGTRDINVLRGLLSPERGLPLIGSLMIVGAMASAGIPGMMGFIAEFIVYRSSFEVFPVQTLLCMIGTGLTAVYFLIMINKVFFGRLPESLANLPRVRWQDRIPSVIVAVLIIFLGIQPSWVSRWSEATATALVTDRLERQVVLQTHVEPLVAEVHPKLIRPTAISPISQPNLPN